MVRFRVRGRCRVRVRVWIVWYMDAQTAAMFRIADLNCNIINLGSQGGFRQSLIN